MTEQPTLKGVDLKVRRAETHCVALNQMVNTVVELHPYEVTSERNPRPGAEGYRYRVGDLVAVPDDWPVYIGEVLYNLRSALDHLAYQLGLLHSGRKMAALANVSAFPLMGRPADFANTDKCGGMWMLQGVAPGHAATIEQLQPYQREREFDDLLWDLWGHFPLPRFLNFLNDLHNAEKHRTLAVVHYAIDYTTHQPTCKVRFSFADSLKSNAVIGHCRCPESDMHMKPKFSIGPALKGGPEGYLLGDALNAFGRAVARVADIFRPDFPTG